MRNNKKQKLNKGRFTIAIKFTVVVDYQKQFDGKPFYIQLFNFMKNKIMLMSILIYYVDTLYYESYRLHAEIKKNLDMDTGYNAY